MKKLIFIIILFSSKLIAGSYDGRGFLCKMNLDGTTYVDLFYTKNSFIHSYSQNISTKAFNKSEVFSDDAYILNGNILSWKRFKFQEYYLNINSGELTNVTLGNEIKGNCNKTFQSFSEIKNFVQGKATTSDISKKDTSQWIGYVAAVTTAAAVKSGLQDKNLTEQYMYDYPLKKRYKHENDCYEEFGNFFKHDAQMKKMYPQNAGAEKSFIFGCVKQIIPHYKIFECTAKKDKDDLMYFKSFPDQPVATFMLREVPSGPSAWYQIIKRGPIDVAVTHGVGLAFTVLFKDQGIKAVTYIDIKKMKGYKIDRNIENDETVSAWEYDCNELVRY